MVKKPSEGIVAVRKGGRLLCNARVAKTLVELVRGLSGTEKIGKKEGLLLVFPLESRWKNGIWMLGMRFSIDVLFIGKDKRIVSIEKNLRPITLNPCTWKSYFPEKNAKYALEVNAGCAEGLKEGDLLNFPR